MADLPRYQSSGALFADVPRLDFASSREQVRGAQNMSTSLDRISDFAFKNAAQQKIREGEQWGYNKPVTAQQIEAAMRGEADIAADLPKAGTFFGDAARKAFAGQLRGTLELATRSELARVLQQVEIGQITDVQQLDREFAGISKGFGDVIARIDPDQANAFRASVATASSPVYKAAVDKISAMYVKVMEEAATTLIGNSGAVIRSAFETNTDPVVLEQQIALERKRVLTEAAKTRNPEFFQAKRKEFDDMVRDARVGVLTDYLLSDNFKDDFYEPVVEVGAPTVEEPGKPAPEYKGRKIVLPGIERPTDAQILAAVSQGKVGKYKAVWATLDQKTREGIEDRLSKEMGDRAKAKREAEADQKEANKRRGMELREQFYRGAIKRDELIANLQALDDIGRDELESLFDEKKKVWDNGKLIFSLDSRVDKGLAGENEIRKLAEEGKISWEQANTLRRNAVNQSPQMSAAKEYIRNEIVGLVGPYGDVSEEKARLAGDVMNQLFSAQYEATKAGKPFDPMATARVLVAGKRTEVNDARRQESEDALKSVLEKNNLRYGTDYTDDSLKRAGVSNDAERKKILRRQKAVTGK